LISEFNSAISSHNEGATVRRDLGLGGPAMSIDEWLTAHKFKAARLA
jgi:hypothetical protein